MRNLRFIFSVRKHVFYNVFFLMRFYWWPTKISLLYFTWLYNSRTTRHLIAHQNVCHSLDLRWFLWPLPVQSTDASGRSIEKSIFPNACLFVCVFVCSWKCSPRVNTTIYRYILHNMNVFSRKNRQTYSIRQKKKKTCEMEEQKMEPNKCISDE